MLVIMQRCHLFECHSVLVIHAAPRDSTSPGDRYPSLEWHPACALAGQISGQEPVVEFAVTPPYSARLGAECVC